MVGGGEPSPLTVTWVGEGARSLEVRGAPRTDGRVTWRVSLAELRGGWSESFATDAAGVEVPSDRLDEPAACAPAAV